MGDLAFELGVEELDYMVAENYEVGDDFDNSGEVDFENVGAAHKRNPDGFSTKDYSPHLKESCIVSCKWPSRWLDREASLYMPGLLDNPSLSDRQRRKWHKTPLHVREKDGMVPEIWHPLPRYAWKVGLLLMTYHLLRQGDISHG